MKLVTILFFLLFVISLPSFSVTHTVTNAATGFTFTPSSITIALGDTVIFSLGSFHSALEVDQATWNANGNTSNGGFNTPFGGGTVIPDRTGTHYFVCGNHYFMGMKGTISVVAPTGVRDQRQTVPAEFALIQNYPNPFNPATSIRYELPVESRVTVSVSNLQGELVSTLVNQVQPAGFQSVEWNATTVASGVYFYRLEATSISDPTRTFKQVRKMAVLK